MRATRAYIAGFGTAGSLLAGAAIVFVFASAVVSFRGWPQVGSQATPVAVIAGQARPSSSPTQVRQFIALASAQAAAVTHQGAAGTGGAGTQLLAGQSSTATLATTHLGSGGTHRATFSSTTSTAPGGSTPPPTSCGTCGTPTLGTTLGAVAQAATNSLGTTVAGTGSRLGSVVGGLTGAVAGKLGAVSPGLANVVAGTGQALNGTIGSATGALGGTLSGLGQGLGGLLSHRPR